MAQKKYYNVQEAATILGVSEDDVKRMQNDRKLTGYRDGADWKFRVEDVEQLAAEAKPGAEEEGDVLLSEEALGESGPGTSGTVIGPSGEKAADSDIQLASDSDLALGAGVEAKSPEEDLDQVLDDELTLEDSGVKLGEEVEEKEKSPSDSGATVELGVEGLEDDDLVLGGSGTGSDVTLGGDSGISLVDPADSGLSLEEPLELGGGDEALELEEDDMLTFDEAAAGDAESPTELKTDEDFLLQPSAEEEEEMESDSQVIPVEAAGAPAEGGEEMFAEAAPLLDEAAPTEAFEGLEEGAVGAPAAFGALPAEMPAAPQATFGLGSILFMGLCVIPVLALAGVMMADLMRNMWSWGGTSSLSSPIMDAILSLVDKK